MSDTHSDHEPEGVSKSKSSASSVDLDREEQNQQFQDSGDRGHSENKENRRKFLKGAVVSAPVILSIASRPVWARGCSLSGQLSGNLSDAQAEEPCQGEGCSSKYWCINGHRFHQNYPADMMFDNAFGVNAYPGKSLMQVCSHVEDQEMVLPYNCQGTMMDGNDGNQQCYNELRDLGSQAVAALQNAASPLKYDLNVESVIASFQAAYNLGTLEAIEETKLAFKRLNSQYCPL